jgi:hypothetical protein
MQSRRHFASKCYDHEWSREMTSAARKITDTQTLGKYVECHIFIVSNLWFSVGQLLILHVKSMFGKYRPARGCCMHVFPVVRFRVQFGKQHTRVRISKTTMIAHVRNMRAFRGLRKTHKCIFFKLQEKSYDYIHEKLNPFDKTCVLIYYITLHYYSTHSDYIKYYAHVTYLA